jgi:hypothetical protein
MDAPTVADLVGKLDATGADFEQNNVVGNVVESLDVQQGDLAVAGVASTPGSTAVDILPVVRDEVVPEAAKSGLETAVEATSGAGAPSSSAPGVPLLNVTREGLKAEPWQLGGQHRTPGGGLAGAMKSVSDQVGSVISRVTDGLRGGGAPTGQSSPDGAGTGDNSE